MKRLPSFLTIGLAMVAATFGASAAEPAEVTRKAAEKAGVKTPAGKSLANEATENNAAAKGKLSASETVTAATGPKTAAGKPEPLKALPDWITPLPGFKAAHGGRRWSTEEMERGEITGTVPGTPREVAESWGKAAKEHFRSVMANDVTINGALTMTVFANYLQEEQLEHKVELELKPGKDGSTSTVKITYTISGEP